MVHSSPTKAHCVTRPPPYLGLGPNYKCLMSAQWTGGKGFWQAGAQAKPMAVPGPDWGWLPKHPDWGQRVTMMTWTLGTLRPNSSYYFHPAASQVEVRAGAVSSDSSLPKGQARWTERTSIPRTLEPHSLLLGPAGP